MEVKALIEVEGATELPRKELEVLLMLGARVVVSECVVAELVLCEASLEVVPCAVICVEVPVVPGCVVAESVLSEASSDVLPCAVICIAAPVVLECAVTESVLSEASSEVVPCIVICVEALVKGATVANVDVLIVTPALAQS